MAEEVKKDSEVVNAPKYYGGTSCIDAMETAYGPEAVYWFCRCNAFKYNWRGGQKKDLANAKLDLEKAVWYLNKANEIFERMQNSQNG